MERLTYARAGGPPDDWRLWRVFDLRDGLEVKDCLEVNTAEGWVRYLAHDSMGRPMLNENRDGWVERRREGQFELRRVDDPPVLGPRRVYAE